MSGGSGSGSSSSSPTKPRSTNNHSHQLRPPPASGNGSYHGSHNPPLSPRPQPQQPPPLFLTIRFSASLPDLQVDIPRPAATTVVALKHLIRSRLGASAGAGVAGSSPSANATTAAISRRRLRFIHAGRILPDAAVLSAALRLPPASLLPPPPPPPRTSSSSAKGKAVEGAAPAPPRVYVNCSIGDVLTDAELADEAEAAALPPPPPTPLATSGGLSSPLHSPLLPSSPRSLSPHGGGGPDGEGERAGLLGAGSGGRRRGNDGGRGFDRLLAAGFTAAEVNQLRLQFRSIQAARHTPDTMPSPDALLSMEDAWMDNNQGGGGNSYATAAGGDPDEEGGGAAGDGGDESGLNGVMDVLLRGMLIGFVWPLGSFGWLIREEGLYSRRWKVFVSFGFVLSLTIGMIRAISGDTK